MKGIVENNRIASQARIAALLTFLAFPLLLYSQAEKKMIREGNREYDKEKYSDSEILYRKAADKNSKLPDAVFNIGDALYKQKKFEEAGKQFLENHNMDDASDKRSSSLYNLGNSLLMANKVQESIEAYKGSLKLNPDNMEAKYNLAYAQDLLIQQEQQQQQQQQNKDQQDQNNDKQDQNEQSQDDKKDQNQNNDQQQQQQQKQQDSQQAISKEDAERVLNALANDEKNVQERVKLAKALKARVRTVKNW
jgi:Ca-activated chloride channel homolog